MGACSGGHSPCSWLARWLDAHPRSELTQTSMRKTRRPIFASRMSQTPQQADRSSRSVQATPSAALALGACSNTLADFVREHAATIRSARAASASRAPACQVARSEAASVRRVACACSRAAPGSSAEPVCRRARHLLQKESRAAPRVVSAIPIRAMASAQRSRTTRISAKMALRAEKTETAGARVSRKSSTVCQRAGSTAIARASAGCLTLRSTAHEFRYRDRTAPQGACLFPQNLRPMKAIGGSASRSAARTPSAARTTVVSSSSIAGEVEVRRATAPRSIACLRDSAHCRTTAVRRAFAASGSTNRSQAGCVFETETPVRTLQFPTRRRPMRMTPPWM